MEATVMCIDNSECCRNGDFEPNRFQAQSDAVNLLAGVKTGANRENTVGVLSCATLAGRTPKVMVTPTPDLAKVLGALSGINIEGKIDLCRSAKIAQLALKHRLNKSQRQRVVIFVGSPIEEPKEVLEKVGKNLKKNNVSVDVVSFGECAEGNKEKLEAFIAAVNKDDTSHYVEAPMGSNLSDFLLSSPIVHQGGQEGGAAPAGVPGVESGGFDFGVDPNIDPELALALRVSAEEERARQAALAQAAAAASGETADPSAAEAAVAAAAAAAPPAAPAAAPVDDGAAPMEEDEDALLQQALALSMQEHAPETTAGPSEPAAAMDDDEDPDMAAALAMSMMDADGGDAVGQEIAQGVEGLPGVDLSDPDVQNAMAEVAKAAEEAEKKEDESK